MSVNDHHAFEPRSRKDHSSEPVKNLPRHHGHAVHLNRDFPEDLASKMMEVGSDRITSKAEARYSEDELPQGISAVAYGPDPYALGNKIIKESARELQHQEGDVTSGGLASMAQRVAQHRNDPSAPEHEVAERIRERIAAEEEVADHHTFQGPNPDKGREPKDAKMRHIGGGGQHFPYVTGGLKSERNPDVEEPRK